MDERWWSVRWRRVVSGMVIALGGLWLLKISAAHVMVWYQAKDIVRNESRAAIQPTALKDIRIGDMKDGVTVSRFGYSLRVPWAETKLVTDFKMASAVGFGDGSSLLMFDPNGRQDLLTPAASNGQALEELRSLLGNEAVKSHYDYAKTMLYAKPTEISLFHSRRTNARGMMLLMMKSMEIPDGTTSVYPVSAPHIRGFQFGDPGIGPTFIELLLFDDHDRGLKLVFKGPRGVVQPVITQEQINGIITSVQTVD